MSVFMWEGLLTNRTDEVFTHGTIPFLQGMGLVGTKCYLSETEHCHTSLNTVVDIWKLTFMTEFWTTTLVLFRLGCSWPPKDPDTICVLIFCVDFLRIMSVAIVVELWQIWEVKDSRSPKVLLPMVRGGHYKMFYCVYVALRWTVDMKTTHILHRVKVDSGHELTHFTPR
jgi:hypothetical protein